MARAHIDSVKNDKGQYDIIKIVKVLVPLIAAAALGWMMMRGFVITPEARDDRIQAVVNEGMDRHEEVGHPEVQEQISNIEEDVKEIKQDVKEQRRVLSRIEAKIDD